MIEIGTLADWSMVIITALGFIFTVISIGRNYKQVKSKNIIEIKKIFNEYSEIHSKLLPKGEWQIKDDFLSSINNHEFEKLIGYLGVFEICHQMLKHKALSNEDFRNFFEYRLQNIAQNKSVMKYINEEKENWQILIQLINKSQNQ